MPDRTNVCTLIVNWNSREDTNHLVNLLVAMDDDPIIVVDNASEELLSLGEPGRHVSVLLSSTNGGYGAGMNIGLLEAQRRGIEWAWLLNPDSVPMPGAKHALLGASVDGAVALGCSQSTDGRGATAYDSAARWHRGRTEVVNCRGCDRGAHLSDVLTGTGLLLDVAAALSVGAFDEGYFHYKEEFDLTLKMGEVGPVVHVCHAHVIHRRGGSLSHDSPDATYYRVRNEFIFHRNFSEGVGQWVHFLSWTFRNGLFTAMDLVRGRSTRGHVYANLQAIRDGWRNKSGKREIS